MAQSGCSEHKRGLRQLAALIILGHHSRDVQGILMSPRVSGAPSLLPTPNLCWRRTAARPYNP